MVPFGTPTGLGPVCLLPRGPSSFGRADLDARKGLLPAVAIVALL